MSHTLGLLMTGGQASELATRRAHVRDGHAARVSAQAARASLDRSRSASHVERRLETPALAAARARRSAPSSSRSSSRACSSPSSAATRSASYEHILRASFGSVGVLSDTLVKATPLIFTGLACALAFRMRLWNIGAEGQLLMGAWGASAVVLVPLAARGDVPVRRRARHGAGGHRRGRRSGRASPGGSRRASTSTRSSPR